MHREETGPEIWAQTGGQIDILIAGVGTGGTLTGCGQYLKPLQPKLQIVAVEPLESPASAGARFGSRDARAGTRTTGVGGGPRGSKNAGGGSTRARETLPS